MSFLVDLMQNRMLVAAVIGWVAAQGAKLILVLIMERKLSWERLFGSGGMPSSHSATVCAMAAAAGVIYGLQSAAFAISVVVAFVVMYDACHVRLETGKQAVAIKQVQTFLKSLGTHLTSGDALKELVGHTVWQVLVGAVVGIVIGIVVGLH